MPRPDPAGPDPARRESGGSRGARPAGPEPAGSGPAARVPPQLRVVVAVVVLEGLVMAGYGGWLLWRLGAGGATNRDVAQGTGVYFLAFGAVVCLLALALARRHGWALGAATFLQVLALPVAWTMLREGFWLGGLPIGVAAVAALVAAVSEPARRAVGR